MRYQGSEAFDLERERALGAQTAPEAQHRRSLVVVEGGHLDEDVRRGVSPQFIVRARRAVVAIVILCVLGAVRVALTSATVPLLQGNLELTSQIEQARDLNNELSAERSLLSSGSRISRIATQLYGMVYNPATSTLDVSVGSGSGSVDAAQDGD